MNKYRSFLLKVQINLLIISSVLPSFTTPPFPTSFISPSPTSPWTPPLPPPAPIGFSVASVHPGTFVAVAGVFIFFPFFRRGVAAPIVFFSFRFWVFHTIQPWLVFFPLVPPCFRGFLLLQVWVTFFLPFILPFLRCILFLRHLFIFEAFTFPQLIVDCWPFPLQFAFSVPLAFAFLGWVFRVPGRVVIVVFRYCWCHHIWSPLIPYHFWSCWIPFQTAWTRQPPANDRPRKRVSA